MKKRLFAGMLAVALTFSTALVSCGGGGGGDDPKALAKQTSVIMQKVMNLKDPSQAVHMAIESDEIEKKVNKLSDAKQAIYYEELKRLTGY
jgi:hypothetical protein